MGSENKVRDKSIDRLLKKLKAAGFKPTVKKAPTISKDDYDFANSKLEEMGEEIKKLGVPVSSPKSRKEDRIKRFKKIKSQIKENKG